MILEALVTTVASDGRVNVAPLGPWVNPQLTQFTLKPFRPSRTYDNLKATGRATIHTTDDVLLIARCVTRTLDTLPKLETFDEGKWHILTSACRYFCVEIEKWEDDALRATAHCRVVHEGTLQPWFGFNRAKHAVLEAAILATRLHLLDPNEVARQVEALAVPVEKTAGPDEQKAFALLQQYIATGSAQVSTN